MEANHNESSFPSEEAENIVKECIENVIGTVDYNPNQASDWTSCILQRCIQRLMEQGKRYKYMVTCALMQRTGGGLHTANSCYWDTSADGSCTVRWDNRTMCCVVSVFAVAIA